MAETNWPAEWIRGALELCVLAVLAEGESYGYAVAQRIEAAGLGRIKGGTLYPIFARLEREGLVTSSWREGDGGPGRKYFTVTARGHEALRERAAQWRRFAERAERLLPETRSLA